MKENMGYRREVGLGVIGVVPGWRGDGPDPPPTTNGPGHSGSHPQPSVG
jgi:hypothetical protein